ncbi:hypothetical protein HanRHA438_Chr06g0262631 [Helianthus annuus]|nr:hypothetical protein HanRHA438_Chr06g0262631 [Helianthus annuus]
MNTQRDVTYSTGGERGLVLRVVGSGQIVVGERDLVAGGVVTVVDLLKAVC